MEYIYGTVRIDGELKENLKTVGDAHSDLSGEVETQRAYADTIITDRCRVLRRYHFDEDADGKRYDWYLIDGHARVLDKSPLVERARADLEAVRADAAQILQDARAGLISPPAQGDPWSVTARYITGDTCTVDGATYVAQRYSRGKAPADSPDCWQVAPVTPTYQAWADITGGTVIKVDTIVTHEGGTWKCVSQHFKSTVYRPKAGSSKWTAA